MTGSGGLDLQISWLTKRKGTPALPPHRYAMLCSGHQDAAPCGRSLYRPSPRHRCRPPGASLEGRGIPPNTPNSNTHREGGRPDLGVGQWVFPFQPRDPHPFLWISEGPRRNTPHQTSFMPLPMPPLKGDCRQESPPGSDARVWAP